MNEKEEYQKFITPEVFVLSNALVKKGTEQSKLKMQRLNSIKRFKQWEKRVKEYHDK